MGSACVSGLLLTPLALRRSSDRVTSTLASTNRPEAKRLLKASSKVS